MTSETTSEAIETSSNVQPIVPDIEYPKSMAAKSLSTVTNTYRFAWRAWLGTAVSTQEAAFDFAQRMAKKGEASERNARRKVNETIEDAKASTAKVRERAKLKIDALEEQVARRMGRSLHFMGVPTRSDVDKLALLMADMSESLEELTALKQQQVQSNSRSKRSPTSS